MSDLRSRFERHIGYCSSREMRLFLNVCQWDDLCECYENNTGDIDLQYYADRLNGAWWMFQELNK